MRAFQRTIERTDRRTLLPVNAKKSYIFLCLTCLFMLWLFGRSICARGGVTLLLTSLCWQFLSQLRQEFHKLM